MHSDVNPPNMGGVRKMELVISSLIQNGHSVVVLSSAMLSISRLAVRSGYCEQIEVEGGGAFQVVYPPALMLRPFGGLVSSFSAARFLRDVTSQYHIDAAIAYNTYLFESLTIKELLAQSSLPVCLEIEDLPLARKRGLLNLKPVFDQLCWHNMLKISSSFLAVNQDIYNILPEDKPKIVLPGVIDQELIEVSEQRNSPFSGTERIVGYFGALNPGKGIEVLFDLVPKLAFPWKLVMTGSGPLAEFCESLSALYPDRFIFYGNVLKTEMIQIMCECDCVVIPKEQITGDGKGVFPFKALEYLVSGSHIISTTLAQQGNLNLSFFQRWDGSLDGLIYNLLCAESDYNVECTLRNSARHAAITKYNMTNVGKDISELLCV